MSGAEPRYVEAIRIRLQQVDERIAEACRRAGRSRGDITLIAVTKTFPPATIAAGIEAGLTDFGENKVQELVRKVRHIPKGLCRWHMIGHLQRNKARLVVRHAASFHALDSVRLAAALNRHAANADTVLPCFVQVNVSREVSKFGLAEGDVDAFMERSNTFGHLELKGLMTLAAPSPDREVVRSQFCKLRELAVRYADLGCTELSMGMSGDFELAIEEGATHIRVGSAVFGPRS